jgi:hypothetical protein
MAVACRPAQRTLARVETRATLPGVEAGTELAE